MDLDYIMSNLNLFPQIVDGFIKENRQEFNNSYWEHMYPEDRQKHINQAILSEECKDIQHMQQEKLCFAQTSENLYDYVRRHCNV